jgi:outer membrane protein TolC
VLNFQLASKRYQAGLSEYTELLNALGFVSQAQASYVSALADQRSAEVDLIQATGAAAQGTKEYFRTRAGQQLLEDMRETELLKGASNQDKERRRPD